MRRKLPSSPDGSVGGAGLFSAESGPKVGSICGGGGVIVSPMEQQEIQAAEHSLLRDRRVAAGLTQRQLAIAARCSLPSVANLEAGVLPRRSNVVPRILAALEVAEREHARGG